MSLHLQLQVSRRRFETSFHATPIGKALVDVTGCCIEVNAALAKMLGYEPERLRGMHFTEFTHPADAEADVELFASVMRGERDSYQLEKRYVRPDGTILHVLLSTTVLRDDNGVPVEFMSEVLDISEHKSMQLALEQANARLHKQVRTDHLTGLCNRYGFEEALGNSPEGQASLVLIDLDNFKQVNDALGHDAGDLVLAEAGRRLSRQGRSGDIVARIGGDEFGIILYEAGQPLAEKVASRIVQELGVPYQLDAAFPPVGASVGVCCAEPGADLNEARILADGALYAAKRAGRGQWRVAGAKLPK
jgi:diguanylate cyclase (GGDEF)-like protein/PAS domain S-box-containing protein